MTLRNISRSIRIVKISRLCFDDLFLPAWAVIIYFFKFSYPSDAELGVK